MDRLEEVTDFLRVKSGASLPFPVARKLSVWPRRGPRKTKAQHDEPRSLNYGAGERIRTLDPRITSAL
jgi:hypothetical protein